MDKGTYRDNYQEVISMEEYLLRRQRIREAGRKNQQSDVVELSLIHISEPTRPY